VVDNDQEDDADPIENGWIDLGEVVTETLALDLDPYPRKPGEAFPGHVEEDAGRAKAPLALRRAGAPRRAVDVAGNCRAVFGMTFTRQSPKP